MKNVIQKALHGGTGILRRGSLKIGVLLAGLVMGLVMPSPNASAITQLEYLQIMVQLSGDSGSFSASSSAADFIQWARNRGMNPSGGWSANAGLRHVTTTGVERIAPRIDTPIRMASGALPFGFGG